jgi:hypothetical protein
MRAGASARVAVAALMSTGLGAGLVACFDLFHSTSGIVSACALDSQACEDAADQVDADAGTDFCAFTPDQALAHAQYACAWLGACETPMGGNAPGTCMFDALLAYDCFANPNHPSRGVAHALWDCLLQVQSCGDVARCVFPGGTPMCPAPTKFPGDFTSCGNGGGVQANGDVRIECRDAGVPAVGENCAMNGQTCASSGTSGSCAGAAGTAGVSCTTDECVGTALHQCGSGGVDVGIDCASNGAGQCGGFPISMDAGWLACVASGDAGSCPPTEAAQCINGYATSCPSGVPEQVYCPELLQAPNAAGGACVAGQLSPPFDWTSPCAVQGGCTADACDDGGIVLGCARGSQYPLDCAAQGLGPCTMVATDVGTAMHARCAPP